MRLYQHQQDAVDRATEGNLALFHECGCGKTLTALKIIKHHKEQGNTPALVVCPLSIIESAWIEDCRTFTPDLSIVSLWHKSPAERYRRLEQDADIFIVNFETFRSMFELIQCKGFQVISVDESSKMKSHSSQTTRALLALAGVASRG
jgi:SNF2 family DNA or RNA helicase